MNPLITLNIVDNIKKYWTKSDTPASFVAHLLHNEKFSTFFKKYNVNDLFIVSMLISAEKNGLNINDEYKKIKNFLFCFSTILVNEHEPDIECDICDGETTLTCSECYGRGYDECGECDGTGLISHYDGDYNYIGDIDCKHCDDGYANCEHCDGAGKSECYNCDGEGDINAKNKLDVTQYYYISYDPRVRDLLELKHKFSEISQNLLDVISDSKTTFIISEERGLMDDYQIENFADNTYYFGELDETEPIIRYNSNLKFDVMNLYDFFH